MPHAVIYQRPMRRPMHQFRVTVASPEGREQFDVHAPSTNEAKREALKLYAAEHDSPITVWAEVH